MNNNPFLKRLIKEDTKEIAHTSAYAGGQGSGSFGSASTESFATRRSIDQNRVAVRKYSDSKIVNEAWIRAPRKTSEESLDTNSAMSNNRHNATNDSNSNTVSSINRIRGEGRADKGSLNNGMQKRDPMRSGFVNRGVTNGSTNKPIQPPVRKNPGINR